MTRPPDPPDSQNPADSTEPNQPPDSEARVDAQPWERIDAYLSGEMNATEAAEFERQAAADAELSRAVAEWRSALDAARVWAAADPPGLKRAESIPVEQLLGAVHPEVSATAKESRPAIVDVADIAGARSPRRAFWRTAVAAALLILGFALGRISQPAPTRGPDKSYGSNGAYETHDPQDVIHAMISVTPTPAAVAASTSATQPAAPVIRTRRSDDHGRIVIETASAGSGNRVTWVIDPNFSLNSANNDSNR